MRYMLRFMIFAALYAEFLADKQHTYTVLKKVKKKEDSDERILPTLFLNGLIHLKGEMLLQRNNEVRVIPFGLHDNGDKREESHFAPHDKFGYNGEESTANNRDLFATNKAYQAKKNFMDYNEDGSRDTNANDFDIGSDSNSESDNTKTCNKAKTNKQYNGKMHNSYESKSQMENNFEHMHKQINSEGDAVSTSNKCKPKTNNVDKTYSDQYDSNVGTTLEKDNKPTCKTKPISDNAETTPETTTNSSYDMDTNVSCKPKPADSTSGNQYESNTVEPIENEATSSCKPKTISNTDDSTQESYTAAPTENELTTTTEPKPVCNADKKVTTEAETNTADTVEQVTNSPCKPKTTPSTAETKPSCKSHATNGIEKTFSSYDSIKSGYKSKLITNIGNAKYNKDFYPLNENESNAPFKITNIPLTNVIPAIKTSYIARPYDYAPQAKFQIHSPTSYNLNTGVPISAANSIHVYKNAPLQNKDSTAYDSYQPHSETTGNRLQVSNIKSFTINSDFQKPYFKNVPELGTNMTLMRVHIPPDMVRASSRTFKLIPSENADNNEEKPQEKPEKEKGFLDVFKGPISTFFNDLSNRLSSSEKKINNIIGKAAQYNELHNPMIETKYTPSYVAGFIPAKDYKFMDKSFVKNKFKRASNKNIERSKKLIKKKRKQNSKQKHRVSEFKTNYEQIPILEVFENSIYTE